MANKIISIDFYADFGMLKKPDTNQPVYLTFNMLHKPAVLGILGAILGLKGFKEPPKKAKIIEEILPEYYQKLKELQISISPKKNYNFSKTIIGYNNTTGHASREEGGILQIQEQIIISPSFTVFIKLDLDNKLHGKLDEYLRMNYAEFVPYLGKNEFHLWWDNYQEYEFEAFKPVEKFRIDSLFIKEEVIKDKVEVDLMGLEEILLGEDESEEKFTYFERLPVGYDIKLLQYEYKMFVYTNFYFKPSIKLGGELYKIYSNGNEYVIQLF